METGSPSLGRVAKVEIEQENRGKGICRREITPMRSFNPFAMTDAGIGWFKIVADAGMFVCFFFLSLFVSSRRISKSRCWNSVDGQKDYAHDSARS